MSTYTTELNKQVHKGIILDLDNTLSTIPKWRLLFRWVEMLSLIRLKKSTNYFRGLRKENLDKALEDELKKRAPDNPFSNLTAMDRMVARHYNGAKVIPHVAKLIDYCDANNLSRAIVSDHPGVEKLKILGMDAGWSAVISCRAQNAFKPLPDGLWAAAAQMGLSPSEIIFVGDRFDTDGLAASAFGCSFIHVKELKNHIHAFNSSS